MITSAGLKQTAITPWIVFACVWACSAPARAMCPCGCGMAVCSCPHNKIQMPSTPNFVDIGPRGGTHGDHRTTMNGHPTGGDFTNSVNENATRGNPVNPNVQPHSMNQQPNYPQLTQQPTYNPPAYNTPAYNTPTYQQPAQQATYNQPAYQQPAQQPTYNRPTYTQPTQQGMAGPETNGSNQAVPRFREPSATEKELTSPRDSEVILIDARNDQVQQETDRQADLQAALSQAKYEASHAYNPPTGRKQIDEDNERYFRGRAEQQAADEAKRKHDRMIQEIDDERESEQDAFAKEEQWREQAKRKHAQELDDELESQKDAIAAQQSKTRVRNSEDFIANLKREIREILPAAKEFHKILEAADLIKEWPGHISGSIPATLPQTVGYIGEVGRMRIDADRGKLDPTADKALEQAADLPKGIFESFRKIKFSDRSDDDGQSRP